MKCARKPSLRYRVYSCVLIVFALSVIQTGSVRAQESLRIAAVVNEEVISAYDLQARLQLIILMSRLPKTQETYQSLAPNTLRTLIDEKLKLIEAENLGISINQDDIDNALKMIEQRNRLQPNTLIDIIERNGIDPTTLIEQIRSEIAWSQIIGIKHRDRVLITEEEIAAAVAAEEQARNQPRYRIAEIILTADNPEDLPRANQEALNLEQQILAGADFASLARSFSQSPSAQRGGEAGWLRQDQIPQEIRSAVLALRPGQITRPIRIPTGFVIIKLQEVRTGTETPKPDATLKLSQFHLPLPGDSPDSTVQSYTQTARKLTENVSNCEAFEKVGKESGSPLSGGMGEVSLLRLPPNLQNAIATLPVGTSSAPIRTAEGIIVLMVCEREDLPVPDTSIDSEDIRLKILNERLAVYARQEIRELRRNAFIEIR